MSVLPFFIVSVPHASDAVPPWLPADRLGDLAGTHHALDRGADKLAHALGHRLGGCVVSGTVSRCFVDLNRSADSGDAVARGIPLLDGEDAHGDLAGRLAIYHRFHAELRRHIAAAHAARRSVVLIDQHSFTRQPEEGSVREVDIGVCFSSASKLQRELLRELQGGGFDARRDEPYPGTHPGAFIGRHYHASKVRTATVEVCDYFLGSEADIAAVGDSLGRSILRAVAA